MKQHDNLNRSDDGFRVQGCGLLGLRLGIRLNRGMRQIMQRDKSNGNDDGFRVQGLGCRVYC